MKIKEIFLLESFFDELESAVRDLLAQYLGQGETEISTSDFREKLASAGFLLSTEELKARLPAMDAVASIDDDTITPKGKIDNDTVDDAEDEPEVDVADMAGDQALSAVKDELPQ